MLINPRLIPRMWSRCKTEGCTEITKHETMCWRCMAQVLSFLQVMGSENISPRYKDRDELIADCQKECGVMKELAK